MLHDHIAGLASGVATAADRRQSDRVPFPGELIVRWFHAPDTPLRYRVADASDDGLRVHSSLPLLQGMMGIVMRLAPGGRQPERTVIVAWVRPCASGGYDAGLRAA